MVSLIFLIAALVLFILAAIGVPASPRVNLVAAGLACMVAAQLVSGYLK
jgi:hypothetical protein